MGIQTVMLTLMLTPMLMLMPMPMLMLTRTRIQMPTQMPTQTLTLIPGLLQPNARPIPDTRAPATHHPARIFRSAWELRRIVRGVLYPAPARGTQPVIKPRDGVLEASARPSHPRELIVFWYVVTTPKVGPARPA
jgi:hypothetical protein